MSTKTKETLTVISQEEIGRDIYSLWLQTDQMAQNARRGSSFLYTQEMEVNFFRDRSASVRLIKKTAKSDWCIA